MCLHQFLTFYFSFSHLITSLINVLYDHVLSIVFFSLLLLYTAIVHQAFIPKMCLQRKIDQHDMLGNKLEKFDFLDHIEDRCDYFEVDDRHSWFCRSQDLTIMQLNIRGLIGKQHELLKLANSLCGTQKLDIILLQENMVEEGYIVES